MSPDLARFVPDHDEGILEHAPDDVIAGGRDLRLMTDEYPGPPEDSLGL